MADLAVVAVVIEPPLSATNSLLRAVRSLVAAVGPGCAEWTPPEQYVAPVMVLEAPFEAAEALTERLKLAFQGIEECPAQLGPLLMDGHGRICSRVKLCGENAASLLDAVEAAARDLGFAGTATRGLAICVGSIVASLEAKVREYLSGLADAPLATWTMAGMCVQAPLSSGPLARVRFVPLKRNSAR